MSTAFLKGFSRHLVEALVRQGHVELIPGQQQQAIDDLSLHLAQSKRSSLVSEVSRGLLSSTAVVELFASDEEIKQAIDNLDPRAARG